MNWHLLGLLLIEYLLWLDWSTIERFCLTVVCNSLILLILFTIFYTWNYLSPLPVTRFTQKHILPFNIVLISSLRVTKTVFLLQRLSASTQGVLRSNWSQWLTSELLLSHFFLFLHVWFKIHHSLMRSLWLLKSFKGNGWSGRLSWAWIFVLLFLNMAHTLESSQGSK